MTVQEIMNYYGSGYRFHKVTGFSHTCLVNWNKAGYIPLATQRKLKLLTQGALIVRLEDAMPG